MVFSLSAYLRTTLALDPLQDLLLEEEVALQAGYLTIEQRRFSDRMAVEIDLPEELRKVPVPSLILQPLVENAVKHGACRKTGGVTIAIRARQEAGRLWLFVENDMALADQQPGGASFGIGLRNVGERLSRRFPDASGFHYGPAWAHAPRAVDMAIASTMVAAHFGRVFRAWERVLSNVICISGVALSGCATYDDEFAGINSRLDQLDTKVQGAAQSADAANQSAQQANQRLDQIEGRVRQLESAPRRVPRG